MSDVPRMSCEVYASVLRDGDRASYITRLLLAKSRGAVCKPVAKERKTEDKTSLFSLYNEFDQEAMQSSVPHIVPARGEGIEVSSRHSC
jgi:hypothetical protein